MVFQPLGPGANVDLSGASHLNPNVRWLERYLRVSHTRMGLGGLRVAVILFGR